MNVPLDTLKRIWEFIKDMFIVAKTAIKPVDVPLTIPFEPMETMLKEEPELPPSELLYQEAKASLGKSLVPIGDDPELGCAACVNELHKRVFGREIGGDVSTFKLQQALLLDATFQEVSWPIRGVIVISATGTSGNQNTPIPHGHVGICGDFGIMSNNSLNGLWQEKYTLKSWRERYVVQGSYKMRFFKKIKI